NLLIDVKAGARQLDLAHLQELSPSLKKLGLGGTVDMDLDVYIPYAAARDSRLNGMLATKNLKFRVAHLKAEKGDSEFNLTGNTALIKSAQVQINGTLLAVTGQIANPLEPNIQLHVTSPDLDLDRLIPPARAEKSGDKPFQEEGGRTPEKTVKTEWPPVAFKTIAHLQIDADTGRYKTIEFQKLKLDATYDRGVIKRGDLSFDMEGGQVAMAGSGDIKDPEHVTFTVNPNITSLTVERLATVLGVPDVSVSGPISLNGRLQGKTGSLKDLLASLDGSLDAQIGPGNIARIGRGGAMMARMLSLTSIKGILTGSVLEDFANKGLPYQKIIAQVDLKGGTMDLTKLRFESDAIDIDAQGRINLLEEQMDVGARLKPLGMVSTAMGVVPLVGKVAASFTEIYFNLSGSLNDPRVSIIPGQGVAGAFEDQAKGVGSVFKGAADLLGREENKWIRKGGESSH
ncbi:MAG: AsmA family protein, partial [Desulfobacteraceae bacterium]